MRKIIFSGSLLLVFIFLLELGIIAKENKEPLNDVEVIRIPLSMAIPDIASVNNVKNTESGILIDYESWQPESWDTLQSQAFVGFDGMVYEDIYKGEPDKRQPKDTFLFQEGLASVMYNDKVGYINESYDWIIPPIYQYGSPFSEEGYAIVRNNGFAAVINREGTILYQATDASEFIGQERLTHIPAYKDISFSDGVALVRSSLRPPCLLTTDWQLVEIEGKYDDIVCKNGTVLGINQLTDIDGEITDYIWTFIGRDGKVIARIQGTDHVGADRARYASYQVLENGDVAFDFLDKRMLVSPEGNIYYEDTGQGQFYNLGKSLICWQSGEEKYSILQRETKAVQEVNIDEGLVCRAGGEYLSFWDPNTAEVIVEEGGIVYTESLKGCLMILKSENTEINMAPKIVDKGRIKPYRFPEDEGILVALNREKLTFDVAPKMENDRVLVPMRAIFEALGAKVDWEEETETTVAQKDGQELQIQINSDTMY